MIDSKMQRPAKISLGRWVRVTSDSPHHVGVCGKVDFYGTGDSDGSVVLAIGGDNFIAVDEFHISLLATED